MQLLYRRIELAIPHLNNSANYYRAKRTVLKLFYLVKVIRSSFLNNFKK